MSAFARRQDIPPVTIEAFDAFLDRQADPRLYELVNFDIIMMSNPTEAHEKIASNIGGPLNLHMSARGCHTYQGGMRVQRDDDSKAGDKYKPDVMVRCGTIGSRTYVTDPIVVIEVMSPSTMDVDRGPKLEFYKTLPSLQHIVFVYQDQMRVEVYRRNESFETGWELTPLSKAEQVMDLEHLEFTQSLADIYRHVSV
jgi:Uma2 family endonuclease